jgi:uncharacterized tellurite resistance protein B-like protein
MIDHQKACMYFHNLYLVAMADRQLAKEEITFLVEVAQQMGIGVRESSDIMMDARSKGLMIPEDEEEKLAQLEDITSMMMVDKRIHEQEYELCLKFAETIGLTKHDFDLMIMKIITKK